MAAHLKSGMLRFDQFKQCCGNRQPTAGMIPRKTMSGLINCIRIPFCPFSSWPLDWQNPTPSFVTINKGSRTRDKRYLSDGQQCLSLPQLHGLCKTGSCHLHSTATGVGGAPDLGSPSHSEPQVLMLAQWQAHDSIPYVRAVCLPLTDSLVHSILFLFMACSHSFILQSQCSKLPQTATQRQAYLNY